MTYDEALALLQEYNQGEFHLKHAYIVSDVMGWFADQLGYGEDVLNRMTKTIPAYLMSDRETAD